MNGPIFPSWNPAWMLIPASVWVILIVLASSVGQSNHKVGARHSLPDPMVEVDRAVKTN